MSLDIRPPRRSPGPLLCLLLLSGLLFACLLPVPADPPHAAAHVPAARAAPTPFTPPGGNAGATIAWTIGLMSSAVCVLGFLTKYLPVRQRELFAIYRRSAVSVGGVSRTAAARAFRDRALQRNILNPACALPEAWESVRAALARAGAAPEPLASPGPFYADVLAQMEVSEHWRDRSPDLAVQLQAFSTPATEPIPAAAAAPVPEDIPGAATFLFTDIQDSTAHWEKLGKRFGPVKEQHDRLLRGLAARFHGREVVSTGDGFFFVFPTGSLAIAYSVALQQAVPTDPDLAAALLPVADALPGGLKVRVGMHSGERVEGDPGTYDGPNTNKAARVCGAGHGGQILVTPETFRDARPNLPSETTCRDLGCYRLKGIAEDVDILQVDDQRLPDHNFPRLNAPSPERVHLPRFLSPFLGRTQDVAELQRLLAEDGKRLVTLVGPAGVGKTRLSVQAAEGVAERFPDGVWFVDLDSAANAGDVFARLVFRLALSSDAQEPDDRRVAGYVAGKKLLFVLDNLEQIARPEDALRVLLDASPAVQCLASSRERVALSGAQTYAVAPLPVPDEGLLDPDALMAVESVRFFVERAQGRDQGFALSPENAPSVAALCRQLEGIPLALELAAAGTAQMTPAEISQEIKTHLDLLGSDFGDLPERHRSVRASLDWSYGRLPADEQRLFAQLSVFSGGLSREAAEAVSDVPQTAECLRALSEKSLLKRQESHGRTRLRLLNTTCLYAAERLAALPDGAEARERHARFFARLAQTQAARLRTAEEVDGAQALEDDLDNLKTALAWAVESGQDAPAADLAFALGTFLERRGRQREARPYVRQGLDACARAGDAQSSAYADLLRLRAGLALDALDLDAARADAARLQALALAQKRPGLEGHAHNLLGIADRGEKHYAEAAAHFREALPFFEAQGDGPDAAALHNNLGVTLMEDPQGDRAEAERRLNQALALWQTGGDRRGMAEALTNLGNLAQTAGDLDGAGRRFAEALARERELQDTSGIARSLSNLGEIAEAQGRAERADRLYAVGQHLFSRVGSPLQSYTQGLRDRLASQHPALRGDHEAAFQAAAEKPQDALVSWALGD